MADVKCNNGGPAFPSPVTAEEEYLSPGMSLRDYFAAKALQSLILGGVAAGVTWTDLDGNKITKVTSATRAFAAYREADAMLAEHDKC